MKNEHIESEHIEIIDDCMRTYHKNSIAHKCWLELKVTLILSVLGQADNRDTEKSCPDCGDKMEKKTIWSCANEKCWEKEKAL